MLPDLSRALARANPVLSDPEPSGLMIDVPVPSFGAKRDLASSSLAAFCCCYSAELLRKPLWLQLESVIFILLLWLIIAEPGIAKSSDAWRR